jgi:phage tail sheath gpL-like
VTIPTLIPEDTQSQRTYGDYTTLINEGVSPTQIEGKEVRTVRMVTTRIQTEDGLSDTSYRDMNTIFTTSYLRQSLLRLIAITYKNYKLTDDGCKVDAGQKVVTPKRMEATILGWFTVMESFALVEDYAQFKKELMVERNKIDKTRVDAIIPPNVVNQFRIFAGELAFRL